MGVKCQMERVQRAAQAMYDKKAKNIIALDISKITSLGDYFVICSCSSAAQLRACTDEIEEKMSEINIEPAHIEGYSGGNWILMDYGDIIIHVMLEETRDFYSLERLWTDAEEITLNLK